MFQYLTLLRDGAICGILALIGVVGCLIMLWHVLDRLPRPPRYMQPPRYPYPTAPPPDPAQRRE